MYKSKTHTCTHAVHTHTVHAGTQIDQQNTSTYSRWHWRVTVKCKPRDYSLRRWEERGGERSGGVLKRGRRRRRKERDKIGGRLICTKPGCCLSVERIWHCWLFMLFQRPPAHQRQLLILSFFLTLLICSSIFQFDFGGGYGHNEWLFFPLLVCSCVTYVTSDTFKSDTVLWTNASL